MANVTCSNCGATLIAGAKFCRQCGRLVVAESAATLTEATTRTLRPPADFGAQPTSYIPSQPTGHAYMSPVEMSSTQPAYVTSTLERKGQKQSIWLLGTLATVALLLIVAAIFALGIIKFNQGGKTATTPPIVTAPEPPGVAVPEIPPPPQPPEPTAPSASNSISREFIYPESEILVDMPSGSGGSLLQLQSADSYQKVLDWYLAKLKPDNIFRSPGQNGVGQNAILKSANLMAVITSTGEGTQIVLKKLDGMETFTDN